MTLKLFGRILSALTSATILVMLSSTVPKHDSQSWGVSEGVCRFPRSLQGFVWGLKFCFLSKEEWGSVDTCLGKGITQENGRNKLVTWCPLFQRMVYVCVFMAS
jgi:hypothetical protein